MSDDLDRIVAALEGLLDYRRHSCASCDGTGSVIVTFDKRDHLGMERDFTGVDVLPHELPQFDYDFVYVRTRCLNCDGTGRIVPKEPPSPSVWSPDG